MTEVCQRFEHKITRATLACGGAGGAGDVLEQPRNFESEAEERSALIHREIFQLAGLVAIAVAAFFVTRAVAAATAT